MKKILLLAVLAGLTATGSYAQNRDCPCKKANTSASTQHRAAKKVVTQRIPTCFMDERKNVGIPGCDEKIYGRDYAYTGYYTKKNVKVPRSAKASDANAKGECGVPVIKTAAPMVYVYTPPTPPRPCYIYTSNSGIVVKECPDKFYDKAPLSAPIEYSSGSTYTGYYPEDVKDPTLMENRVIEGVSVPRFDLSFWDSE